jgi:DNA repair exonuclease SbcCD ATPase subunit
LSYKDQTISFNPNETLAIIGHNGSGKSSIFKALTYALFGKIPSTPRTTETDLINTETLVGQMFVEVTIILNDQEITIKRGRTRDNQPVMEVTGLSGKVSEIQVGLAKMLNCTYLDFISLTYFVQEDIHLFLLGDKTDYFARWTSGLQVWTRYSAIIKEKRQEVTDQIHILKYKIQDLKGRISNKRDYQNILEFLHTQISEVSERKKKADELLHSLQLQVDQHHKETWQNAAKDAERLRLRSRYQSQLDSLQNELKRIQEGICPTLSIHCDLLQVSQAQAKSKTQEQINTLTKEISSLGDVQEVAYNPLQDLQIRIEKGKHVVHNYETAISNHTKNIAIHEDRLREITEYEQTLLDLESQIAPLEVRGLHLARLAHACSDKGVPLSILIQELHQVSNICNEILETLESNKRIQFTPYQELGTYEKVCPVCGGSEWSGGRCSGCGTDRPKKRKYQPSLEILDGRSTRIFELESGGEKVLISFAVRLACAYLVSSMTGFQSNFIILDETFAMLDATNRQRLLHLVTEKLPKIGYKQIFLISHHSDILSTISRTITVDRNTTGHSEIQER